MARVSIPLVVCSKTHPLVLGRVIGNVTDNFNPNHVEMRVTYEVDKAVVNGAEFSPSAVIRQPKVEILGGELRSLFTLVMTDPDFPNPSDPYLREHLHWIVTDIPGTTDATYGKEVVKYQMPKQEVGIHRYVFILFRQMGHQTMKKIPTRRSNFETRKFAKENELGSPVAVVYFNCQRETAKRRRG